MNACGLKTVAVCLFALVNAPMLLGTEKKAHPLEGTWQAVAVEDGGEARPPEEVMKARMTITGNKIKLQDGEFSEEYAIQLDPSKTPQAFDVEVPTESGQTLRVLGIYKLERDKLTVCFEIESVGRPTEFRTTPTSGLLIVWQRVKP